MTAEDVHRRLLRLAVDLAEENARLGRGGPFGAVVARDGEVVATGTNAVVSSRDPTAHAEVRAIRAACEALRTHQLTGCDLYASAEPCPMCFGAIYWARPRAVYFAATKDEAAAAGFDDVLLEREAALPHGRRRIPFRRLLAEEGGRPFAAWLADEGRRAY